MNGRQRKKRNKKHDITIIVGSTGMYKAEDYEMMRKRIEDQMKAGSIIVLPPHLRLVAVVRQQGSRHIKIERESEAAGILRLRGKVRQQ